LGRSSPYRAYHHQWSLDIDRKESCFGPTSNAQFTANGPKELEGILDFLWADAICIDQKDVSERNVQVQLMGEIYRRARIVFALLHCDDGTVTLAIQSLNRVAQALALRSAAGTNSHSWTKEVPELFRDNVNRGTYNKNWNAVDDFLSHPYWGRLWILQETVLAANLAITDGNAVLGFEDLELVHQWCDYLRKHPTTGSEAIYPIVLNALRTPGVIYWSTVNIIAHYWDRLQKNLRIPIWDALKTVRVKGYKARDPRDMIYGYLVISPIEIVPDYSKSVRDLYCEVSERLVADAGLTHFLHLAGIGVDVENKSSLPSWVPNWHSIALNEPRFPC
jgi:hypothetical protein